MDHLVDGIGLEILFNRKSTTFRKLEEAEQALAQSKSGIYTLVRTSPTLLKRPLLETPKGWLVGFKESQYVELFS